MVFLTVCYITLFVIAFCWWVWVILNKHKCYNIKIHNKNEYDNNNRGSGGFFIIFSITFFLIIFWFVIICLLLYTWKEVIIGILLSLLYFCGAGLFLEGCKVWGIILFISSLGLFASFIYYRTYKIKIEKLY